MARASVELSSLRCWQTCFCIGTHGLTPIFDFLLVAPAQPCQSHDRSGEHRCAYVTRAAHDPAEFLASTLRFVAVEPWPSAE